MALYTAITEPDQQYDAIVIGSGMGGLTTAAFMAKYGMRVLVLEQHYAVGGYLSGFQRRGFQFDSSVNFINQLSKNGLLTSILPKLGLNKEDLFLRIDPTFTLASEKYRLSVSSDLDKTIRQLIQMFPHERANIDRFFEHFREILAEGTNVGMGRRFFELPSAQRAGLDGKTVQEVFDFFFDDPELKTVLNFPVLDPNQDVMPWIADWMSIARGDLHYPIGGGQRLVDSVGGVVQKFGGHIMLRAKVAEILIDDNNRTYGVRLQDGREIRSTYIVSNSNPKVTFLDMISPEHLDENFRSGIRNREVAGSFFTVYLGIDKRFDFTQYGLESPYIHYNLSEAEIESMEDSGFFRVSKYLDIVSQYFCPWNDVKLDPEMPTVKIYTTAYANYDQNWNTLLDGNKRGPNYRTLKKRLMNQFIDIAEKVVPGLKGHILFADAASPLTYERYTLNTGGSCMGWELGVEGFRNRLDQRSPIEGLFLAGQWTFPGYGGTGPVAFSGFTAANLILRESMAVRK